MNKDISVMIELQRLWDGISRCHNDIEKDRKSILYWETQLNEKIKEFNIFEEATRHIKSSAKQKEVELSSMDEQLKRLDKRRDILTNEKEMKALDHEVAKIKEDKDNIENALIESFDIIEKRDSEIIEHKNVIADMNAQTSSDIKELNERIERFIHSAEENQKKFDILAEDMSPSVKSRFLKLIKSQNGTAIAPLQGNNCGSCKTEITFSLVQDAAKENSVVICSNCGRFIYKI
jgi:uncharacterized protein